jgi:hypothetical protein
MLNFSAEPRLLPVPQRENACVLLSTHMDRKGSCVPSELRANEGVIVEMGPATR